MNDRNLCEVITTFRLVTELRICHHHKAIGVCKYGCDLVWEVFANFTQSDTLMLTLKHHNFTHFPNFSILFKQ